MTKPILNKTNCPNCIESYLELSITICGGGNAAQTAAAYLGSKPGFSVRVLTRRPGVWKKTLLLKTDESSWANRGDIFGRLVSVSDQPEQVIPMAKIVLIASPAHTHKDILEKIFPYVHEGTILGCLFGQGGFDWTVKKIFKDFSVLDGIFAFQNIPWICCIVRDGEIVQLIGPKKLLALTCYPKSKKDEFARLAFTLFDIPCTTVPNFLCLTLCPSNQIIHPARYYALFHDWDTKSLIPFNRIQWGLYTDFDDLSAEILTKLDDELQAIKQALLNYDSQLDLSPVLPIKERILLHYGSDVGNMTSLKTIMQSNKGYAGCKTPVIIREDGCLPALNSRLFWEDIPFGLCVLKSIAQMVHVKTPHIDEVIRWHQRLMGKEYVLPCGSLNESLRHETGVPEASDIYTVTDLLSLYHDD